MAITVVGTTQKTRVGGVASTTLSFTVANAGSLIVVNILIFNANGTTVSVSDASGSYTQAGGTSGDASSQAFQFYKENHPSGSYTLTVDPAGGAADVEFWVTEITGVKTSGSLDARSGQNTGPTDITTPATASVVAAGALAQADNIIIALCTHTSDNRDFSNPIVQGAAGTEIGEQIDNSSGQCGYVFYRKTSSSSAPTTSCQIAGSTIAGTWGIFQGIYKAETAVPAFSDNFNRANGALGANWTQQGSAGAVVASNKATQPTGTKTGAYWATAPANANNQFSQAIVTLGTPGGLGLIVRASGTKYYVCGVYDNFINLAYYDNGGPFQLTSAVCTLASGDLVRFEVEGNKLRAYINGVLSPMGEYVDTGNTVPSGGSVGLYFNSSGGDPGSFDDWYGGSLGDIVPIYSETGSATTLITGSGSKSVVSGPEVTFDAASEFERTLTTTPQTWTHTPVGAPNGVVVTVVHGTSATDHVTGVTYGGVALTRVVTITDAAGEPGRSDIWFRGTGIPTGPQTVSVTLASATTDDIHFVCITLRTYDGSDMEVVDSDSQGGDFANPSRTLQYNSRACIAIGSLYSGLQNLTDVTLGAGLTLVHDMDMGQFISKVFRQTAVGTSDFTIGAIGALDDVAFAVAAFGRTLAYVKTGLGKIDARIGSGFKQYTYAETGLSRSINVGSGAKTRDAERFGLGISQKVSSGAKQTTYSESASATTIFTASGFEGFVFSKTGSSLGIFVGSGPKASIFGESGIGVSPRIGTGFKSSTFSESGIGIFREVGSGTKLSSFSRSGTATNAWVGTGFYSHTAGANEYLRTGQASVVWVGSGPRARDFAKTGLSTSAFVGTGEKAIVRIRSGISSAVWLSSGPRTNTSSRTASGILSWVGNGADASTISKSGLGIVDRIASGADSYNAVKVGSGISSNIATGSRSVNVNRTGSGASPWIGRGTQELAGIGIVSKSGIATSSFFGASFRQIIANRSGTGITVKFGASGLDFVENVKNGVGVLPSIGSATKNIARSRSGIAFLDHIASGFASAERTKEGSATSILYGYGFKDLEISRTGSGALLSVGSGIRTITLERVGLSIAIFSASGRKIISDGSEVDTALSLYGIRKDILIMLKDTIDGLIIWDGPPPIVLTAENTYCDPILRISQLPLGSVIPDPENIRVGLFGVTKDRTMRVNILAYTIDKPLFDAAEDIIARIINTLTSIENATKFIENGFSITEIGPVVSEQMEINGDLAYISVPLTTQFLLDQS
jgi:hypothetical protein